MRTTLVVALLLIAPTAAADLGQPSSVAERNGGTYAARFGAVDQLIDEDDAGNVIMECWQAPARLWTESEGLLIGKLLARKRVEPVAAETDGHLHSFRFPDGTGIHLSEGSPGHFISVEVTAPGIEPSC